MRLSQESNPPAPPPQKEASKELRERLLRCPKLAATIRKIARSQGVPVNECDDIVQETLLRASKTPWPEAEDEARKFIHGIAKHVSIDYMRAKEEACESLESHVRTQAPNAVDHAVRSFLNNVFAKAAAKFGAKWDWYVAHRIEGKTSQEIGAAHGVESNQVRRDLSVMDRWLAASYGKKGGIGAAFLLLLALGVGAWWKHHSVPTPDGRTSNYIYATDLPKDGPPPEAAELRESAKYACAHDAWRTCESDLAAAREMDPIGTTEAWWTLEKKAHAVEQYIQYEELPDTSNLYAKPPR